MCFTRILCPTAGPGDVGRSDGPVDSRGQHYFIIISQSHQGHQHRRLTVAVMLTWHQEQGRPPYLRFDLSGRRLQVNKAWVNIDLAYVYPKYDLDLRLQEDFESNANIFVYHGFPGTVPCYAM